MQKGLVFLLLILANLTLASCSASLSPSVARKSIAELGTSRLIPDAVDVRRIVGQTENRAIVEANVALAFEFARDDKNHNWRIVSVRLGEGQWINLETLLDALNEERRHQTSEAMRKLAAGVQEYRRQRGAVPDAQDVVGLTDVLHPQFLSDLVRNDAWGHPIEYEILDSTSFHLRSLGPDGNPGTADDIVIDGQLVAQP